MLSPVVHSTDDIEKYRANNLATFSTMPHIFHALQVHSHSIPHLPIPKSGGRICSIILYVTQDRAWMSHSFNE